MQFEIVSRPAMTALDPALIFQQPTTTKALALCQSASGKPDSHFYGDGGIVSNQSQWSRIFSESSPHCFPHEKLNARLVELMRQQWLSPQDALRLAGCFSLSQRVSELKREHGLPIVDEWRQVGRSRFKCYTLMEANA